MLLTFWKSWSAPCLTMLRELQGLHAQSGRRGPVIVAVGDGENAEDVAAFRREHNLAFTMAPDPTRRIARAYGVNCWPAMVLIDEQGVIERVRFGISSHHSAKIGRR